MTYRIFDIALQPHDVTALAPAYEFCAQFVQWADKYSALIEDAATLDDDLFSEIENARKHLNHNILTIQKMNADPAIALPHKKREYRKIVAGMREAAETFVG
jgi:hypothetical protein